LALPDFMLVNKSQLHWSASMLLQLSLSLVPAPPRGYIHLSSGTPSSRANCVEVRMHAAARLMLLNAFISKGSEGSVSQCKAGTGYISEQTWMANHAILLARSSNILSRLRRTAVVPRVGIVFCNSCELAVKLQDACQIDRNSDWTEQVALPLRSLCDYRPPTARELHGNHSRTAGISGWGSQCDVWLPSLDEAS
jgi:hypothetical protein